MTDGSHLVPSTAIVVNPTSKLIHTVKGRGGQGMGRGLIGVRGM